jgi:anti-anti-sigma regulatory factor
VVDCSDLTFIGTAGLELLLAAERRNRPTTRFEVRHPSQILRRMLAILRLDLHLRDIGPS